MMGPIGLNCLWLAFVLGGLFPDGLDPLFVCVLHGPFASTSKYDK